MTANLSIARARDNLKIAFMVHAANVRVSKIMRSDAAYLKAYTLGERRAASVQALALAATQRRRAKRALRNLKITLHFIKEGTVLS